MLNDSIHTNTDRYQFECPKNMVFSMEGSYAHHYSTRAARHGFLHGLLRIISRTDKLMRNLFLNKFLGGIILDL